MGNYSITYGSKEYRENVLIKISLPDCVWLFDVLPNLGFLERGTIEAKSLQLHTPRLRICDLDFSQHISCYHTFLVANQLGHLLKRFI